MIHRYWWWCHR